MQQAAEKTEAQEVAFTETPGGKIEDMTEAEREAALIKELTDENGLQKMVTMEYIKTKIADAATFTAPGTNLVICYITMKSGATVTGEANFTDVETFDEARGNEQAYNDAMRKLIALEIYALADRRAVLADGGSKKFYGVPTYAQAKSHCEANAGNASPVHQFVRDYTPNVCHEDFHSAFDKAARHLISNCNNPLA